MSNPYAAPSMVAANDSPPPGSRPFRRFTSQPSAPLPSIDRSSLPRTTDGARPGTISSAAGPDQRHHVSDARGTQAVIVSGRTVYVQGQVGIDRDGELVGPGDCRRQAEQAMRNVVRILADAGSDLDHVVKLTSLLTDARYRQPVAQVVGDWLRGVHVVTSELIVIGLGEPEWLVEIQVVAVAP